MTAEPTAQPFAGAACKAGMLKRRSDGSWGYHTHAHAWRNYHPRRHGSDFLVEPLPSGRDSHSLDWATVADSLIQRPRSPPFPEK